MSYILDALRKAERERVQSVAPAAAWQPPAAPATERDFGHYRPVLLGVLCALLVAALLITSAHDRNAAQAAAESAAESANAAALAANAASTAAERSADNRDDEVALNLRQQHPETLNDVVADPDADPEAQEAERAALNAMVVHRDAPAAERGVADGQQTPAVSAPAPSAEAPAEDAPAPRVTEVERVQLQPAPAPQVTKLRDMPADYRSAFPLLSLDVHSYDPSPKKRFIMLSGKRYNEGDTLREGPRIVQIVSDGVVFEYRGEQVLFTIAH